jgi:hypothetical protein
MSPFGFAGRSAPGGIHPAERPGTNLGTVSRAECWS